MKTSRSVLILVLIASVIYQPEASARKWTDRSGRFSVEAEFVDARDETVWLRKEDGEVISLPLAKLSEADQAFVRQRASEKEAPKTPKTSSGKTESGKSPRAIWYSVDADLVTIHNTPWGSLQHKERLSPGLSKQTLVSAEYAFGSAKFRDVKHPPMLGLYVEKGEIVRVTWDYEEIPSFLDLASEQGEGASRFARYAVQIDPDDATLAVRQDQTLRTTVSVEGSRRIVTAANVNGSKKLVLRVGKPGFLPEEREFRPAPGATEDVVFRLQPVVVQATWSSLPLGGASVNVISGKDSGKPPLDIDQTGGLIKKAAVVSATLKPFRLVASLEVETEATSHDFVVLVGTGAQDGVRELVQQHAAEFLTSKQPLQFDNLGQRISLVQGRIWRNDRAGTRQVWEVMSVFAQAERMKLGPGFGKAPVTFYLLKRDGTAIGPISESRTVEANFSDSAPPSVAGAVPLLADRRITLPIDDYAMQVESAQFRTIVFLPNGKGIVGACGNARLACSLDGQPLWRRLDSAQTVSLTADGQRCLFAAGNWITNHDAMSGKKLSECDLGEQPASRAGGLQADLHVAENGAVQFAPDGQFVLAAVRVGSRGQERGFGVRVYGTQRGNEIRRFPETHTAAITCLALSPDGANLLTGSEDKTVRLWNVARGKELRVYQARDRVYGLCWSADGARFAAADGDRTSAAVRVWDTKTGEELRRLDSLGATATRVALSSDGRLVAAQGRIWEVDSGELRFVLPDDMLGDHPLMFTPNDRELVVVQDSLSFWRLP